MESRLFLYLLLKLGKNRYIDSTLLILSISIISKIPVDISYGKFEVLRLFAFSADCYIFYTRSLFTSKRRAITSARSVLVLARTFGFGSVRRLYFTSPRQLANKDRNKFISYNKTSIERIDIDIIAKN